MNILITGGAGFIGSHLADKLIETNKVTIIDNLSSGNKALVNSRAEFIKKDLCNDDLNALFENQDIVFHTAANREVRIGTENPWVHLEQNVLVTYRVLEAMRVNRVRKIVFTSTSTVYGEAPTPTPENWGPLMPISTYGASKLACEALISSYCHTFDFQSWIFRLANVVGPRLNHGVIYDFITKLNTNPKELLILGDGEQSKSYLYIDDCISGILTGLKSQDKVNILNIGSEDQITSTQIALAVARELHLQPDLRYTGGNRGWRGDVPKMLLSVEKLQGLGWNVELNSEKAVMETIKSILAESIHENKTDENNKFVKVY